jgi:hypothetical protein
MYGYGYSLYNRLAFLGGLDPNASAFLTATGITDPTITNAVNSLCIDLKKYGVWSKMKAIYPFCGGTATTHKFNLVNPLDDDSAFRLSFNGGITHSSNGILPNGTNGYGDTFLTPSTSLSQNSTHISFYSRTNIANMGSDLGSSNLLYSNGLYITPRYTDNNTYFRINGNNRQYTSSGSLGYFIGTRTSSSVARIFQNNILRAIDTLTSTGLNNFTLNVGALNGGGTRDFSNRQLSFATIGDGLTDEDSANLYYSVQKFQTTLGRQVGTPIYSSNATDVNARLFLGATNIQDVTITSAVDTLVQGLKTDGIWSKLKAVYPFVGGTATTHKFNLANALDEDSAFRLVFNGGWTHSSTGALPNGTNGYADTKFIPSTSFSSNNNSFGLYSRTDNVDGAIFMGTSTATANRLFMFVKFTALGASQFNHNSSNNIIPLLLNSSGYFHSNRIAAGTQKVFVNGALNTTAFTSEQGLSTVPIFLSSANSTAVAGFSNRQLAFAHFADGLTDTEASNLYTRVQAFQTTLNRQV